VSNAASPPPTPRQAPANVAVRHLDLRDPGFLQDPYPVLAAIRRETPVFWDPVWKKLFVLRYEDIADLLKLRVLGRSLGKLNRDELGFPPPDPQLRDFEHFQANHLLDMEPPGHTRLRSLVQKAFTVARVEGLRERIATVVADSVAGLGPEFDAVRQFAEPLPVTVIAELLGVDERYRHHLRPWSAAIVKLFELDYSDAEVVAANQAVVEFSTLIRGLAEARRITPQDDLITALVHVEEAGEKLSMDELVANCILFLNAGHEATVNGLANALLNLWRYPDERQHLLELLERPQPKAWQLAIEELLRFDTPLPMFERWVYEPMAWNGLELPAGLEIALVYASGNRDEARFAEPNMLNLGREPNHHLTFGLGTHYCIGAPLARMEMTVALQQFLRRFPCYTIPEQALRYGGFVIRGLEQLRVVG
jgi:cytochrome P450